MQISEKDKKILIAIIILVLFCVIVAACVGAFVLTTVLAPNSSKDLKDLNGDESIALNTITTEDITSRAMNSFFYKSTKSTKRRNTLYSDYLNTYSEYNYETINLKAEKFNGVSILQATKPKNGTVTLVMDSKITKGNFRAIVMVGGNYYADFELDGESRVVVDNATGKEILVKIAGEEACIDVKISRVYD